MVKLCVYMGKNLRVDFFNELISVEELLDQAILRKPLGETGLGVIFRYEEVLDGGDFPAHENQVIWSMGVSTSTKAQGSGTYGIVTKIHLTNPPASLQAICSSLCLPMILTNSNKRSKTAVQEDRKWL